MANFNHVCSREGTTCSSYLNCSALRRNAVVAKSAGMDWHTSSGSNDMVCGESEIAFYTKGKCRTGVGTRHSPPGPRFSQRLVAAHCSIV